MRSLSEVFESFFCFFKLMIFLSVSYLLFGKISFQIRKKDSVVDECRKQLNDLSLGESVDDKIKSELKKRKLVAEV